MSYTYEELPSAIKNLKRSAIDAYMGSMGWRVIDTEYSVVSSVHVTQHYRVTRPSEDGEGGGEVRAMPGASQQGIDIFSESLKNAFADLRARVDTIMSSWKDISSKGSLDMIGTEIDEVGGVVMKLITDGSSAPEGSQGSLASVSLDADLNALHDTISGRFVGQEGKAIEAAAAYYRKLDATMNNLANYASALAAALAHERSYLTATRQAVADAINDAISKCDALAESSGGATVEGGVFVLNLLATVIGTAGATPVGMAAAALSIGASVLGVVEEAAKTLEVAASSTASAILDSFEGVLKDINNALEAQENNLADALNSTLDRMSNDANVDPTPVGVSAEQANDPTLHIIDYNLTMLGTEDLPALRDNYVLPASKELSGVIMSSLVYRNSGIGRDTYGVNREFLRLRADVISLIKELGEEITNGAANMLAIRNEFRATDEEIEQTFTDLTEVTDNVQSWER